MYILYYTLDIINYILCFIYYRLTYYMWTTYDYIYIYVCMYVYIYMKVSEDIWWCTTYENFGRCTLIYDYPVHMTYDLWCTEYEIVWYMKKMMENNHSNKTRWSYSDLIESQSYSYSGFIPLYQLAWASKGTISCWTNQKFWKPPEFGRW